MGRVAQASGRSRERLERISHHFLSGPDERSAAGGRTPPLIPVLAAPGADLPLALLPQAFLARGRSSAVLDARRGVRTASRPDPSDPTHPQASAPPAVRGGGGGPADLEGLLRDAAALDPAPDLCLAPLAADDWPLPGGFGRPLLLARTDRDGVREAYLCLKALAMAGHAGPVGVVMAAAPDEEAARRHFDLLAEGALRFLGLEAVSYGYAPEPPPAHAPVDLLGPGPEARLAAALDGIARLLATDLEADLAPDRAPEMATDAPAPAPAP